PGVESHGDAQGYLGKDRAAPGGIGLGAVSCREENPMVQETADVEMKRSVAAATPGPLPREELAVLDAYWRASNYLSVGQIYLYDNPLLKKPLQREHIKPRLLGHWGTTPGLNLMYVHLNRVITKHDLNMIYVIGPGHGGPALVAQAYLEGTYSEVYPDIGQDEAGMKK